MLGVIANFAILFLLSQGFDSMLRWVFELVKAGALIYLRDGLMLVAVVLGYVDMVANLRDAIAPLGMLTFVLCAALIGFASGLNATQVVFGIKVWLPAMLGFVLVTSNAVDLLDRPRFWAWVWAILVFGIVLNLFVTYPWAGMMMNVGGQEIEANREWTTQSFNRSSGFSRTSFDAAVFIILLAFYLVAKDPLPWRRVVMWLVSGGAIVLTTTKGAILAFLIATFALPLVMTVQPGYEHLQRGRRYLACAVVTVFGFFGVAMPLAASQFWKGGFEQGTLEDLLFASFGDRVAVTWPAAFRLIDSWQYITGRGLGGIGSAQTYFELRRFTPADNMFLYLYVTAGLVGAALYLFPLIGVWRLKITELGDFLAFCVILFAFVFGMTVNVVESAVALMALGAAAAQFTKRRAAAMDYATQHYYPEYGA